MRLITETELTGRKDAELAALFHKVSQMLVAAKPGTSGRCAVIASLQNISSACASRQHHPKGPKP